MPGVIMPLNIIESRFWIRVRKEASGCWIWTGAVSSSGYGSVGVHGKNICCHRFSYEMRHGKIPQKLQIDHLCRVKLCVNPEHLEVVTKEENNRRGFSPSAINIRKSFCPKGHPYYGSNLRLKKCGGRECRECDNAKHRRLYHSKRFR